MKLIDEYRVPLMGMSVAAAALSISFVTAPVHAAGCLVSTDCTYYGGGPGQPGKCGTYSGPTGPDCVCTSGSNSEHQAACAT